MLAQVVLVSIFVVQAAPQHPPPPSVPLVHGYVYFDHGSDVPRPFGEIDPIAYLTEFMPLDAHPYVRGQTDSVGSVVANLALARRRAQAVARLLVAEGVDPSRITLVVCNEAEQNRPTADEVSEPLNRFAMFDWTSQPLEPTENCRPEPYRPSAGGC